MPHFSQSPKFSQTSASDHPGTLHLVATPIGNMADFSLRAVETLKQADLVLCEDTRVSSYLMREYGINTPLQSFHDHNEEQRIPLLLNKLLSGMNIALISDAGTPVISDPGFKLIRACIEANIPISGIPGPNAALMALTLSGFPPHPFLFAGFPASRQKARQKEFAVIHGAERAGLNMSVIWHESPHRLIEMLEDVSAVFSAQRYVAVARELTKKFEDVRRGPVSELILYYQQTPPRGEITVVMAPDVSKTATPTEQIDAHILAALEEMSLKDAAAFVAQSLHLPKKIVYGRTLELAKRNKS